MKKIIALFLSLAMIACLVACGQKAPAKTPNEPVELLVWTFLNPADESGRGKVLGDAVKMYEDANPNVHVNVESLQWDTMTAKFFAAAQTNEAPDVIWINGMDLGQAIQLGVVEPFENLFLKDWTEEQIADIDDARFQYGTTDGNHYQIHLSTNIFGILYRADLFEKFDIDPNFKSWDELIEAAQKLTFVDEETGMQVYGLGSAYSTDNALNCVLDAALFTNYGDIVDENGQANWAGDVGQKALQMQIDMIDKYGITPSSALSQNSEEVYADFCAGKYAMMFGGATRVPTVKSQCAFDPDAVKLMAYPDMDGNTGKSLAAGWNVCVWSGSQHKEEAGKFIETLCCPEIDKEWVVEGGQIPLLKSTVEATADFISLPENEYLATAADMLVNNAVTYNSQFVISGYTKDLNQAMQYAYVDGYSVADALAKTAAEFNQRCGN